MTDVDTEPVKDSTGITEAGDTTNTLTALQVTARTSVQNIKAYSPPLEGRRQFTRLDFNENTTGYPEYFEGTDGNLLTAYPEYEAFTEQLANLLEVTPDQLLITNGSDEALFVISFCFIEPSRDTAITANPTFALIPHYLKLVQSQLIEIPFTAAYQYDTEAIENTLSTTVVKLAIFASPDNPVGALIPLEKLEHWCQKHPQTLFVIDEAYTEYSRQTALPLIKKYSNLLVTRTFSKAWGLAGLRLGCVIGHPELIATLRCVRSPYSVNTMAVHMASKLIPHYRQVVSDAQKTMERKASLITSIEGRGYSVVNGNGNFFMVKVGWLAADWSAFFRKQQILIRDRSSHPKLPGMVRVSVGSQKEVQQFIDGLDTYRQKSILVFDMDGTLVDTSKSFDITVARLVEKHSGKPFKQEELEALRTRGGFNDDWDATRHLLKQRGIDKSYKEIAIEGQAIYLSLAKEAEEWLIEPKTLKALKKRYRLAVATGRYRNEFDSVWKERFAPYFEVVVCQDDISPLKKKPEPDIIQQALTLMNASEGVYIGNSVDDMIAAHAAGLRAIGLSTTMSSEALVKAGAETVLSQPNQLEGLLVP